MKGKHDFVEEIANVKGPKQIHPNNIVVKYCSCVTQKYKRVL